MDKSSGKDDFIAGLKEKNIDLVLRYTEEGRIYGATYIDHNTQTVLNGSRLGKEFSANALENWFSNVGEKPVVVTVPDADDAANNGHHHTQSTHTDTHSASFENSTQQTHSHDREKDYDNLPSVPDLGGLFQTGPAYDADEEAFYREMQRRRKKKRRGPKL